jgi:hypothetical protein
MILPGFAETHGFAERGEEEPVSTSAENALWCRATWQPEK